MFFVSGELNTLLAQPGYRYAHRPRGQSKIVLISLKAVFAIADKRGKMPVGTLLNRTMTGLESVPGHPPESITADIWPADPVAGSAGRDRHINLVP